MKRITFVLALLVTTVFISGVQSQSNCHASFRFHQAGLVVSFTDASTSHNSITSWLWNFGDGSNSTQQNPSHTYIPGHTYNVCLTIQDSHGCSNTYCQHVIVSNAHECHASFTFHVDTTGTIVQFTNTSTGTTANTTYLWNFGDSTTSTDQNPEHTYTLPGANVVCLIITDTEIGCSSHICHTVHHGHHNYHGDVSLYPHDSFSQNVSALTPLPSASLSDNTEPAVGDMKVVTFPNPFNGSTTIEYSLSKNSNVIIELCDMLGSKVFEFEKSNEAAGIHKQLINVENISQGFYYLRFSADNMTSVSKVFIVK